MGIFKGKTTVMPSFAQIGEENTNGDIVWTIVDYDYAWALFQGGVLEDRGWKVINEIHYKLFYLPPPAHHRTYGP